MRPKNLRNYLLVLSLLVCIAMLAPPVQGQLITTAIGCRSITLHAYASGDSTMFYWALRPLDATFDDLEIVERHGVDGKRLPTFIHNYDRSQVANLVEHQYAVNLSATSATMSLYVTVTNGGTVYYVACSKEFVPLQSGNPYVSLLPLVVK